MILRSVLFYYFSKYTRVLRRVISDEIGKHNPCSYMLKQPMWPCLAIVRSLIPKYIEFRCIYRIGMFASNAKCRKDFFHSSMFAISHNTLTSLSLSRVWFRHTTYAHMSYNHLCTHCSIWFGGKCSLFILREHFCTVLTKSLILVFLNKVY